MSMTKAERAALEKAQREARMAKALRFPTDDVPQPMTEAEIKAACIHEVPSRYGRGQTQMVARGWFQNAYSSRVTYGCSDGHFHNHDGDRTSTQTMGTMYRTKLEALRAMRHDKVLEVAKILADIDERIEIEQANQAKQANPDDAT